MQKNYYYGIFIKYTYTYKYIKNKYIYHFLEDKASPRYIKTS